MMGKGSKDRVRDLKRFGENYDGIRWGKRPEHILAGAEVGTRIWFAEEKRPYRVRARGRRYLVCTKPYNPKHTVVYTVVDLEENVRGTENLIFGMGAETDQQCEDMVARLEGPGHKRIFGENTEVSYRNRALVNVARVENGDG